MKTKKKTHTRASLNLYLIAGLYLLFLDYSLLSKLSEVESSKKVIVIIAAIVFGIFAIGIITYSLKGTIAMTKGIKVEEMEEIEDTKEEEN